MENYSFIPADETGREFPASTPPLPQSARWGNHLASAGFTLAVIFAAMGLTAGYWADSFSYYHRTTQAVPASGEMSAFALFITISYLIMSVIYLFPSVYLGRLAGKTRKTVRREGKKIPPHTAAKLRNYFAFTAVLLVIGGIMLVSGIAMIAIGPQSFQ